MHSIDDAIFDQFVDCIQSLQMHSDSVWPDIGQTYPPDLSQTLRFFIDTIFARSRATFALIRNGCCWEAEIILRSLYEAHARSILFCVANDHEPLLHEFWVANLSSSDRKTALKARLSSELFPNGSPDSDIFRFLQEPSVFDVEPKANKAARRRLDQKWSFPEVLNAIEEASKEGISFPGSKALLHMYGVQSEILHVSAKYYDLLWDRAIRGDDLVDSENGHIARQLSDMVWMAGTSLSYALRRLGFTSEKFAFPLQVCEEFSGSIAPIKEQFDSSQQGFYDEKFGRNGSP